MSCCFGLAHVREAPLDGRDDGGRRVVDAQRRLRDDRELVAARVHALRRRPRPRRGGRCPIRELAHRPLDLGVALVADHDELVAFAGAASDLDVDLRDQRASRVEDLEAAPRGVGCAHRLADAVRAEHHRRARRHLVELLDEDRALRPQVGDDVLVVDDLVAHVDRCAEFFQRALDDLDRQVNAGTEAARPRRGRLPPEPPLYRHPQQVDVEAHGLAGERMVEVEQQPVVADGAHDAGVRAAAVGERQGREGRRRRRRP